MMAEDRADLRRWVMCGAVIVFAHGAIAAGMVTWRGEIEPAEPAAAIVIEFAPMSVAPATPQTEIPPGPEQVMSDASPNKPVETLEEKRKVEEALSGGSTISSRARGRSDLLQPRPARACDQQPDRALIGRERARRGGPGAIAPRATLSGPTARIAGRACGSERADPLQSPVKFA